MGVMYRARLVSTAVRSDVVVRKAVTSTVGVGCVYYT
jgi:hypothetical protein